MASELLIKLKQSYNLKIFHYIQDFLVLRSNQRSTIEWAKIIDSINAMSIHHCIHFELIDEIFLIIILRSARSIFTVFS